MKNSNHFKTSALSFSYAKRNLAPKFFPYLQNSALRFLPQNRLDPDELTDQPPNGHRVTNHRTSLSFGRLRVTTVHRKATRTVHHQAHSHRTPLKNHHTPTRDEPPPPCRGEFSLFSPFPSDFLWWCDPNSGFSSLFSIYFWFVGCLVFLWIFPRSTRIVYSRFETSPFG